MVSLWILSFHDYSLRDFEDRSQDLIEKVLKTLDFFNKEKLVRIVLLLLDSLSSASKTCLEIMSDLSCLQIIEKLQQRHWVDEDIVKLLENLWKLLDENYQEFTSIGKFAKEVHTGFLRKGPVHSERFWQDNFVYFDQEDNLALIEDLVKMIENPPNDRTAEVALFDLGEFAKYYKFGRNFLDNLELKPKIYKLMQTTESSDVRKEAITTLQKMVMTNWEK